MFVKIRFFSTFPIPFGLKKDEWMDKEMFFIKIDTSFLDCVDKRAYFIRTSIFKLNIRPVR